MAQVVTTEALIEAQLKSYYSGDKVDALLPRQSPVWKEIKKERISGKEYRYTMLARGGGGVSANYLRAVALSANQGGNQECVMGPGKCFAAFPINHLEMAASQDKQGAYLPVLVDKMYASTDYWRRQLGASLYASGYGEFGRVPAGGLLAGVTTITLPDDAIMKIEVGSSFEVTNGDYPSDALHAGGPHTVTAIDGNVVTFAPAVPAGGWAAGDWLCYDGGRDAGNLPNYPDGFASILPAFDNRTGAGWLAYIATLFRGVNRSTSVQRLAGNFVLRDIGGGESRAECLIRALSVTRNAGAIPDMIVVNPADWAQIAADLGVSVNYMQQINNSDKGAANEIQAGLSAMGFQFSTSWIKYVVDDPFCPIGRAYLLDKESWKFLGLSNPSASDDGIKNNNPGVQDITAGPTVSAENYAFNLNDYLTVQPGTDTADGPAARVSLRLYGNLACRAPGHNTVVSFV